MAETSLPRPIRRLDRVWLAIPGFAVLIALLDPAGTPGILEDAALSLAGTAPFIAFAVIAVAVVSAAGAEAMLARAFEGREVRMIVLAAVFGGLSPFCSCEVIPFVAALLAVGAPLSAVMAFWLASPLMDPAMFLITMGALGPELALAKLGAAVAIGLSGGFLVKLASDAGAFRDVLRQAPIKRCGCGPSPFEGRPAWRFWHEAERRRAFRDAAVENALFLLKWLALAYLIEAAMVAHLPADLVAGALGGEGVLPIVTAALVGGPAYLNGYAAPALVEGLLSQGMSQGAALSFLIAGGVSCIPAALAVWALVKPRVFAAYIGIAFAGAVAAGLIWGAVA